MFPNRPLLGCCALLLLLLLPGIQVVARKPCAGSHTPTQKRMAAYVRKLSKKWAKGHQLAPGGRSYTTFFYALDSITARLSRLNCVEAATWDKCMGKILLYPGHSTIGIRMKQEYEGQEWCFYFSEGKIRRINRWLGWMHYFPDREKLFYIRASVCSGFVAEQQSLCDKK
jgi:hypothetical protein